MEYGNKTKEELITILKHKDNEITLLNEIVSLQEKKIKEFLFLALNNQ